MSGVLLGVFCSACGPSDRFLTYNLPQEIEWYGAVFIDETERPFAADELRSTDGTLRFEVPDGASKVQVFGYTAQQLAPIQSILDSLETRPLEPTEGCAPTLPPPELALMVDGDLTERLAPEALVELTGAWLQTACPPARFGLDLHSPWCGQSAEAAGGCSLRLDWATCPIGSPGLSGWQSPFGSEACVSSPADAEACHQLETENDEATLTLECPQGGGTQTIEVLRAPTEPRFEIDVITVTPDVQNPGVSGGHTRESFTGQQSDLVVTTNHVVVASLGEEWTWFLQCAGVEPSELHVFDRKTLERQTIIAGPSCTTRLLELPGADSFVAFGWRASDGMLVATRYAGTSSVTSVAFSSPVVAGRVKDALMVGEEIAAVIGSDPDHEAEVVILDPSTLSILDRFDFTEFSDPTLNGPIVTSMTRYRDGLVIIADDRRNRFHFVDIPGRRVLDESSDVLGTRSVWVASGHYFAANDRIAIAIADDNAAVHVFSSESFVDRVFPIEHNADPVSLSEWPSDPRYALVGFVDKPENTARIALMDLAVPRLLAGSAVLGEGTVSRLRPGPDGEVWGLLPWSGTVARIRPH